MELQRSSEKFFPPEVNNDQVIAYLERLAELIDNQKVRKLSDPQIPYEADGFLGPERAGFAEKIQLIAQMLRQMTKTLTSEGRLLLEKTVIKIIAASVDPYEAMVIVSRVWKYFLDDDGKGDRMLPEDFQCLLDAYAQKKGMGLTHAEEFVLLPALRKWKSGDDIRELFGEIDEMVQKAFDAAHDEDAEFNGKSRGQLERKFNHLAEIQSFVSTTIKAAIKENGSAK